MVQTWGHPWATMLVSLCIPSNFYLADHLKILQEGTDVELERTDNMMIGTLSLALETLLSSFHLRYILVGFFLLQNMVCLPVVLFQPASFVILAGRSVSPYMNFLAPIPLHPSHGFHSMGWAPTGSKQTQTLAHRETERSATFASRLRRGFRCLMRVSADRLCDDAQIHWYPLSLTSSIAPKHINTVIHHVKPQRIWPPDRYTST